ncbi:hypothetical protein [Photobacterium kishitanii]|uniref:hypothetical protein n=1 Tax=Photobacterium kishitanii TaxID=318456 RepID=UPI000D15C366|nr:hypothetical protein [Photobacterium kishitanii]PSU20457.1 hypothetical protein CTM84_12680 [Photobacterium kishitanii]
MSKFFWLTWACVAILPAHVSASEWNSSGIDGHYVLSSLIDEQQDLKKVSFSLYKAKYNNNGFERFLSQCNKDGFDKTVSMTINGQEVKMDKICRRTADSKNYWVYTPTTHQGLAFLITQFKYTEIVKIHKVFINTYNQKTNLNFRVSAKGFTQSWKKSKRVI